MSDTETLLAGNPPEDGLGRHRDFYRTLEAEAASVGPTVPEEPEQPAPNADEARRAIATMPEQSTPDQIQADADEIIKGLEDLLAAEAAKTNAALADLAATPEAQAHPEEMQRVRDVVGGLRDRIAGFVREHKGVLIELGFLAADLLLDAAGVHVPAGVVGGGIYVGFKGLIRAGQLAVAAYEDHKSVAKHRAA